VRILTLALGIPFPPVGGGLTRTFHLLRALATHHEVVLAGFDYGEPGGIPPYPIHVESVPWTWSRAYLEMTGGDADAARLAYERLTFQEDDPWFASVMDPAPMNQALDRLLRVRPDLVLLEGTPLAHFLPALPADVPRVLDLFDVHAAIARQELDGAPPGDRAAAREAARTLAFERRAARSCRACLTVSEEDRRAAQTMLGVSRVYLVHNGVDTAHFAPHEAMSERGALLLTGRMDYGPNADAAAYFAAEVLPLVRGVVSDACFHVVGANPLPSVTALASEAVVVHGRVDDVRPHLSRAEVVVVPLRAGGGTRLKVLEAAASGKAIVSTPLGIQGLPLRAGHDVLVADSPGAFAAAVVALLRDPPRRAVLGANARRVASRFDWSGIGESFRRVIEDIARHRGKTM
jgi:glycosyltransferase involved in cell wall biosynthesis